MDSCLAGHNANRGLYDNGQLTREWILDLNHTVKHDYCLRIQ